MFYKNQYFVEITKIPLKQIIKLFKNTTELIKILYSSFHDSQTLTDVIDSVIGGKLITILVLLDLIKAFSLPRSLLLIQICIKLNELKGVDFSDSDNL